MVRAATRWRGVAIAREFRGAPFTHERTMTIRHYRDLTVWQRAMELAEASYRFARKLPASERFGLAEQIRRSAVSVPANIAEGHSREHRGDYLHFLSIARGSLAELETHFLLAVRVSHVKDEQIAPALALASETGRMLTALVRALRASGPVARRTRSPRRGASPPQAVP